MFSQASTPSARAFRAAYGYNLKAILRHPSGPDFQGTASFFWFRPSFIVLCTGPPQRNRPGSSERANPIPTTMSPRA
jgi:hypothetical protein